MATAQAQKSDTTLQDYTIGWISALPIELAAAKEMLDEVHPNKPNTVAGDTNTYVLGRVGDHNVALACLPSGSYGTNSAAVVASHMMRTFPNLRFGLMVGIGGGVPSKDHDIRLGDVVVSKPQREFGGVIQIDLGKDTTQGFERTGMLNKPPNLLMTALSEMEADSVFNGSGALPDILDCVRQRHPRKAEDLSYDSSKDKLYEATYDHPPRDTCDGCDERKLIDRPDRPHNDPVIHYGLIASGNQVEKSGPTRDRLREQLGVLCFDMEAAGLMNHFPCIVIRGICDYADSHKNKRWQLYAATVAAAYAKEFLGKVPPAAVESADLAAKVCEQLLSKIEDRIDPLVIAHENTQNERILKWLSRSAHRARHANLQVERKGNAGQWFLDSEEFQEWLDTRKNTLFCPGIPGAGKTFVISRVVDKLLDVYKDDRDTAVVYIYCEYARKSEQTSSSLIAAIIRQLSECNLSLPVALRRLSRECKLGEGEERRPTYSELNGALTEIAQNYHRIFLIVDALDECSNEAFRELIFSIRDLCQRAPVSLMLTSRPIPQVIELLKWDIRLRIEATKEDIRSYLDKRSHEIRVLRSNPDLTEEVMEGITEAAGGMFLLARLHSDSLSSTRTPREVRDALEGFRSAPQGQAKLNQAYRNAIERIEQSDRDCKWAYKMLTWIVYAIRPLSLRELQHALAIKPGEDSIHKDDFADPTDIVSLCAGLVTINEETETVQLVHYTTKEFFENYKPEQMHNAHEELSVFCLTYLSYSKFASLAREGASMHITPAGVFAENAEYAFLPYAVRNWGHHVRHCRKGSWRSFEKLVINYLGSEDLILMANKVYSKTGWRWSHYLASFGLDEIFEYVVENELGKNFGSFDIDCPDESSDSPLYVAIDYGSVDVVRLLLDLRSCCGVDVISHHPRTGLTPLGRAINTKNYEVVRLLAELPPETIDLNSTTQGSDDCPPLISAIFRGTTDIVKLLLLLGPDRVNPYQPSIVHGEPFRVAAAESQCEMMELLLSYHPKVDPDVEDALGVTPLIYAAKYGDLDVVKFLIELGPEKVNVNARDGYGETALHKAAYVGYDSIMEELRNRPVNLSTLDLEVSYRGPSMSGAGQEHGIVVGETNDEVWTLHWTDPFRRKWHSVQETAWEGQLQVVKSLCSLGPERLDVNACTPDGRTALHLAIAKKRYEVAEFLIGMGERVDLKIEDANGDTARDLAAATGPDFIQLFPETTVVVEDV